MKMRRNGGFSLLEVVIAMALLSVVMAMVYLSLFSSSAEYEVNSKRAWILHQARVTIDEMTEDIRQSNRLSLIPIPATPPAGQESAPTNAMSFKKVLAPVAGVPQYTANPITYMWQKCDNTTSVTSPVTGTSYPLGGATWVDANNNGKFDEGRIVRIDPNPGPDGRTYPARIMCNYVKDDPEGFKITQAFVTVNGVRQVQVHITLTLVFTDSKNRVQEQVVETKVFMRNSQ